MTDEVVHTEETCDNCGGGILKVDPEETDRAAYICDPEDGCGVVKRYDDE